MIKMEVKDTKRILESQLNEIFARLHIIDEEIKRIDHRFHRLNEEIEKTGNFNNVQLEWEELKWDKWMYSQEKEAKLLLVDDKMEKMTKINMQN